MIDHLYVDNYKCFTNFEWKPGSLCLLLGDNGSGKSSLFDIVETIRDFISSPTSTTERFPCSTLTAWDSRSEQTFELGIAGNGGRYLYRLVVEGNLEIKKSRIQSESLKYDNILLYSFEDSEAHLFRDDGSEGPIFPVDGSRSALGTIPTRNDNQKLTWFRERLSRIHVFSPHPKGMTSFTDRELETPDRYLGSFVSWLDYLRNDFGLPTKLNKALDPVLGGFQGMRLERVGPSVKELRFTFRLAENGVDGSDYEIPFNQLSDGQRCLTALYTALLVAESSEVSLLWDEPDNFVALRELQPWLSEVRDMVEKPGRQCFFTSHHPEIINTLGPESGQILYRESGGPVRIKPFPSDTVGISPAELVARGWEV